LKTMIHALKNLEAFHPSGLVPECAQGEIGKPTTSGQLKRPIPGNSVKPLHFAANIAVCNRVTSPCELSRRLNAGTLSRGG